MSPTRVDTPSWPSYDEEYGSSGYGSRVSKSSPASSVASSCTLETASLPEPFFPPSLLPIAHPVYHLPSQLPPLPVDPIPERVALEDECTPDNWVKRNPELVRLTGKHPFNTEARLKTLFDAGFLTPASLHFVRNHGAVPKFDDLKANSWSIRVHGLVENEMIFTIDDLRTIFQVVTLPVTLVCAGNRRKEQNVVRKSLGFNWGAAGVSTALWTGVYLADVLGYVRPRRGLAKYVIFEGCDELPNGPYGTSQRMSLAINKDNRMLIAWAMNGLPLEPDHGFPIRVIIPGQIGGRSVKWLRSIEISAQESQHYLHFWDNKVLPMQLEPDRARSEKHWWYDPNYLITELNVNSAIAKPDHDETLDVTHNEESLTYTLRGYAYAGGGRRVNRVELSFDEGDNWILANIDYPEDLYRSFVYQSDVYGKLDLTNSDTCFCWCLWHYEVTVKILSASGAIMVRAMDEAMNVQPRDMYLNATSMLNNWWFRIAVQKVMVGPKTILRFEHPTLAGTQSGGWMERLKAAGEDILKPSFGELRPKSAASSRPMPKEIALTKPGVTRRITYDEVRSRDRQKPWFIVNGEVYDGTPFLKEHPGGNDSILLVAGEDASEDFLNIHSDDGKIKLAAYHIGTLTGAIPSADSESANDTASSSNEAFLNPKKWKSVTLINVIRVNHDSCLYRFSLPEPTQKLGLPVSKHVFVRLKRKDTKEMIQRAYTPISPQDATGFIDILVKLYLPSDGFPTGGKMSLGLNQLLVGDAIEVKGPLGSFVWEGQGICRWKGIERLAREIGMICGGSGITPVLQVLRSILRDPEDRRTKIWLIYANKTVADILCREELDALFKLHGEDRLKVHYTLGKIPEGWAYSTGRITDSMLANHLPSPSGDGLILACGPEPMIAQAVKPGLLRLGWDIERSVVVF